MQHTSVYFFVTPEREKQEERQKEEEKESKRKRRKKKRKLREEKERNSNKNKEDAEKQCLNCLQRSACTEIHVPVRRKDLGGILICNSLHKYGVCLHVHTLVCVFV